MAANRDFFPYTTLRAHIIDTKGDPAVAEKAVMEYATTHPNRTHLVGIVGKNHVPCTMYHTEDGGAISIFIIGFIIAVTLYGFYA